MADIHGVVDEPANRDDAGRFQPGASGNPSGRAKKLPELAAKISEFDDELRDRLLLIARVGEHRDSIAAVKLLWSYAHGNPSQSITGENGAPLFGQSELVIAALKKLAEEK